MKNQLSIFFMIASTIATAQKLVVDKISQSVSISDVKAHVTFLAADEMRGRDTGSPEIEIAANYIRSYFQQYGLKPYDTFGNYFQEVKMYRQVPATSLTFQAKDQTFKDSDVISFNGDNTNVKGNIVFVGQGSAEDFSKADVKGKIAVVLMGDGGNLNLNKAVLVNSPEKASLAKNSGAVALVELAAIPGPAFQAVGNFMRSKFGILDPDKENGIPHVWIKLNEVDAIAKMKEPGLAGALKIEGASKSDVAGKNVVGYIQGTDPALNQEFIAITGHYDHVGVGAKNSEQDSIFNGARDNATGVTAMLACAKYFSQNKPKRSLLFIAFTGEEKGLLGSEWFVNHPTIPLKQIVFNSDCDGAGYNDTTLVTVIGLERTSMTNEIEKSAAAFGLKAKGDPAPEQNLYERSDNYNFALKGIPAIDFAPGVKAFDQELFKYYHQQTDEVESLDFDYLIKYFRAFVYVNYLLANTATPIKWTPGDKFESAGKRLYGK